MSRNLRRNYGALRFLPEDSVPMKSKFDLVVIGSGAAASTVASRCRSAGWEVAIIDSRPFGGTCALRGCDPKKVLVGAAEVIDWMRRMIGHGIHSPGARIDWPDLMRFKRSFTDPVPGSREKNFAEMGIKAFHERAHFVDRTSVNTGESVLEARHIVIASGATPKKLNIPGEQFISTSDVFLELERLPRQIVFIGGGYISFEFAHIAARAGSEVTILHRGQLPLEGFDPDLVRKLLEVTNRVGVQVELLAEVKAVEKDGQRLSVITSSNGNRKAFNADLVVHGAGRVAEIGDLNLAAAEIQAAERGVEVNDYLQSVSNPAIYAAGDAAASSLPKLTPVAAYEGNIVASNLLEGNHRKVEPVAVPSIVFTVPALASVGLSEHAAHQNGLRFRVNAENTSSWYSSKRVREQCSGFKVLIEEGTDGILGAHVIGAQAEELINPFALAMQAGIPASKLKSTLLGYPTGASDLSYMI
jgi:glutathione reductase (NADPH)